MEKMHAGVGVTRISFELHCVTLLGVSQLLIIIIFIYLELCNHHYENNENLPARKAEKILSHSLLARPKFPCSVGSLVRVMS